MLPYDMKRFLIATILLLSLSSIPIYAQEDTVDEDSKVEIQTQEQTEETDNQEVTTLSEELQIEETESISFLTILFAILTPALLIVVAYLLIKMSNK